MASRAGSSDTGLWRETVKAGAVRGGALVASVAVFVATLLMALSLASYHAADAALNTAAGGDVQNLVGSPGAWFADLALSLFGPAVALLLPIGPIVGLRLWRDQPAGRWVRMLRNAAIGVALVATALATISDAAVLALPAGWGGAIGLSLVGIAAWALGFANDPMISTWGLRAIGLIAGSAGVIVWARSLELALGDRRWRRRVAAPGAAYDAALDEDEPLTLTRKAAGAPRAVAAPDPRPAPVIADRTLAPSTAKPKPKQTQLDLGHSYKLPTLDLLSPPPPPIKGAIDKAALERNARLLENVLDDFKVRGRITEVRPGPVVTMYELEPESGVKASRVIALADDIARNMSAISARVATIPGRTVIGIELPNAKREAVALHELVASQTFEDQSAQRQAEGDAEDRPRQGRDLARLDDHDQSVARGEEGGQGSGDDAHRAERQAEEAEEREECGEDKGGDPALLTCPFSRAHAFTPSPRPTICQGMIQGLARRVRVRAHGASRRRRPRVRSPA